jgi:endoglucanase
MRRLLFALVASSLALLGCACGGGSGGAASVASTSSGSGSTAGASCTAQTPAGCVATGMRDITSTQLAAQMGVGWNLGNSLEAIGGETTWGNAATTPQLLAAVKAAGFRTIRIPVSWKQYADASDTISASWMARVAAVVDAARAAGLVAIVNIHWDGGWMQPTTAQQAAVNARIAKFWTQIATRFKGYDDGLLFAGTNEVHIENDYGAPSAENLAVQNGFNQVFVDAVRATGGNNVVRHLVVQSYNTNIAFGVASAVLPTDPAAHRLMMEVHFYDPYEFTLKQDSTTWQWGRQATDASKVPGWGDEAWVDAQFQLAKTKFVDQGVPVILGEFSATARLTIPAAAAYRLYWDKFVATSAHAHGLVPVYWDSGATGDNTSGLFDRATGAKVYGDIIDAVVAAGN